MTTVLTRKPERSKVQTFSREGIMKCPSKGDQGENEHAFIQVVEGRNRKRAVSGFL